MHNILGALMLQLSRGLLKSIQMLLLSLEYIFYLLLSLGKRQNTQNAHYSVTCVVKCKEICEIIVVIV
jgi:hypothetical protein